MKLLWSLRYRFICLWCSSSTSCSTFNKGLTVFACQRLARARAAHDRPHRVTDRIALGIVDQQPLVTSRFTPDVSSRLAERNSVTLTTTERGKKNEYPLTKYDERRPPTNKNAIPALLCQLDPVPDCSSFYKEMQGRCSCQLPRPPLTH